jgi:hypothetical protein
MGMREWAANAPMAMFGPFHLRKDSIKKVNEGEFPLDGVAARVEAGADMESRVTATRLVALGVFAFAAKKKSGGEAYLTIEGPEFFWTETVDRKKRAAAQRFAALVNNQVRSLATSQEPRT